MDKGLSKRRALSVVRMSASVLRCELRPDRNVELRERILALAQRHKRYGVGMIHLKLRQAGVPVNYKRTERLYQEDMIVKRWMAEKLEIITEELGSIRTPSMLELQEWPEENKALFAKAGYCTFRHLYFSPNQRGPEAAEDAASALAALDGEPADAILVQSDTLMRPSQVWVEITVAPSRWSVARAYARYGVEHILGGVD